MKTYPSDSSPEDELIGGCVGDTARPVSVTTGEDTGTGFGVYRGEAAVGDGGKGSMMIPNADSPIGRPESLWQS